MSQSLAEYFAANRYQPKYEFMARVEGKYKNIPFVGSVGNDTVISEADGPVFHIFLDLPMKVGGKYIDHIFCKHSEIKGLKLRTSNDIQDRSSGDSKRPNRRSK